MAICEYCGCDTTGSVNYCKYCGAPLPPVPAVPEEKPEPPVYTWQNYPNVHSYAQPVAPVSTGGLIAWSIITILLCLIPGIVALVKTLTINKAATVEDQQKRMKSARIWCIVGTVLGVLTMVGAMAGN